MSETLHSPNLATEQMPSPPPVQTYDMNKAVGVFESVNESEAATASQVKTALSILGLISRKTKEETVAGYLYAKGYKVERRGDEEKEFFLFQ